MEWDNIGLLFSLSRFKTYVNFTTSTDCYLVTGSIGGSCLGGMCLGVCVWGYMSYGILVLGSMCSGE